MIRFLLLPYFNFQEAIESAIKDGLILDAMVLARWVCPQKLEKVDAAFLSRRAEQNPVMTLLSVAHGLPAPVLVRFVEYYLASSAFVIILFLGFIFEAKCLLLFNQLFKFASEQFIGVLLVSTQRDILRVCVKMYYFSWTAVFS